MNQQIHPDVSITPTTDHNTKFETKTETSTSTNVTMQNIERDFKEFRLKGLRILSSLTGYDILPASGKVVVFDDSLPIKYAFMGLVEHDIKCGPVWSSSYRDFIGMVTVTDFIDILMYYHTHKDDGMAESRSIEDLTVEQWNDIKLESEGCSERTLIHILPEDSLLEGVRKLHDHCIHRLPVMQIEPENTVLCIINHQRMLRCMIMKMNDDFASRDLLAKLTVGDLFEHGVGTAVVDLITAKLDAAVVDLLGFLNKHAIPCIPLLDNDGKYLDSYTRSDVRFLALDGHYRNITISVQEAIGHHHVKAHSRVPTTSRAEPLYSLFHRLLQNRKHVSVCLNPDGSLMGILTIGDVFAFFLRDSDSIEMACKLSDLTNDESMNTQSVAQRSRASSVPLRSVGFKTSRRSKDTVGDGHSRTLSDSHGERVATTSVAPIPEEYEGSS
eukprot:173155_1